MLNLLFMIPVGIIFYSRTSPLGFIFIRLKAREAFSSNISFIARQLSLLSSRTRNVLTYNTFVGKLGHRNTLKALIFAGTNFCRNLFLQEFIFAINKFVYFARIYFREYREFFSFETLKKYFKVALSTLKVILFH